MLKTSRQAHPKAIRLILVRHGEGTHYELIKKQVHTGRAPWAKLTAEGKRQAAWTGKQLKGRKIDIMAVSPLQRTVQTAEILRRYVHPKKVLLDDRLMEKISGVPDGTPYSKIDREPYHLTHRQWRYRREPKGESWHMTMLRARSFLKDIEKDAAGKTVMIVAHGHLNRAFLYLLTGLRSHVWIQQKHAAYSELVVSPRGVLIISLNVHPEQD